MRGAEGRAQPLSEPARERRAVELAPEGSGARTRALRILIVEHDAAVAEILRFLLAPDGHEVTITSEPDAALAAVRTLEPDIALIGIGVPGAPWEALARRMRVSAASNIRLIATTGFGSEASRVEARLADFDALLEKPESLLELLEELAPRPRRGRVGVDRSRPRCAHNGDRRDARVSCSTSGSASTPSLGTTTAGLARCTRAPSGSTMSAAPPRRRGAEAPRQLSRSSGHCVRFSRLFAARQSDVCLLPELRSSCASTAATRWRSGHTSTGRRPHEVLVRCDITDE